MAEDTIARIERPDIVVADTGPLIHLSQVSALGLLHEIGGAVIVVDMVGHEAMRSLDKPEAEALKRWIEDGQRPKSNYPVRIERTETGRIYEIALRADAAVRMKDGGETAIVQWLAETVDATDAQTIVIHENGKVPAWIGNRALDADIDILTTRAFLVLAESRGLIDSAERLWRRIEAASPTGNPAIVAAGHGRQVGRIDEGRRRT